MRPLAPTGRHSVEMSLSAGRGCRRREPLPGTAVRSVISLIILTLALVAHSATLDLPENPPETRRAETVAPGIEHVEIRRGDFTAAVEADRWTINVLTLDPGRVRLALGRAFDGGVGVETTSSISARHGALAGVNGGYFRTEGLYRGEPAGIVVRGAKVLSEPSRRRPGLAVSNADGRTRLAFASLAFRADIVAADGSTRAVSGVNRPRLDDELILFTPEFHLTTLTSPNGIEAVVAAGLVVAVHDGAGSQSVPPNGYVLSAHGLARRWLREHLRPGGRVELRASAIFEPALPFDPDFVLGGGPVLLRDGAPAADAGEYAAGFRLARHPRTAVGVRADGTVVLAVVDGRQPGLSVGMTIDELTALMTGLGCVAAINLDGGGSTTMVVRDRVVNHPSDAGGERPVGDALLVFLR